MLLIYTMVVQRFRHFGTPKFDKIMCIYLMKIPSGDPGYNKSSILLACLSYKEIKLGDPSDETA